MRRRFSIKLRATQTADNKSQTTGSAAGHCRLEFTRLDNAAAHRRQSVCWA